MLEVLTMKWIFSAICLYLSISTAALAVVYDCSITRNDPSGWLPDSLTIEYDSSTGEVTVHDPLIQRFLGGPTNGEIDVSNQKRTTFKWIVEGVTNTLAQFATIQYRATIIENSRKITVTGKPLGYVDNFRGTGRCRIRQ